MSRTQSTTQIETPQNSEKTYPQKKLLTLIDGSNLKIATPFKRGPIKNWYMTYDKEGVWEASTLEKRKLYKADLFSSRTSIKIICADIDTLPANFSFDELEAGLKEIYSPREAIVTRSASNKVKVFFAINTNNQNFDSQIAFNILTDLFAKNETLMACVDRKGIRITYLNCVLLKALVERLPSLEPIVTLKLKAKRGSGLVINTSLPTYKPYKSYQGDLNELFPGFKEIGARKETLKILLQSLELLNPKGFHFSTAKAAKDIGVAITRAWKAREHYLNIGWLKKINSQYAAGVYAQCFVADGDLRIAMFKLYPKSMTDFIRNVPPYFTKVYQSISCKCAT